MKRQRGVTLIELMVTVAIIGLLSAIAYPAYGQYVLRGHRSSAQAYLLDLAHAQSQYLADNRAYADSAEDLGVATPASVAERYEIAIETGATPPTYTITATPITTGPQAGDPELTINQAGTKTPGDKW
ncbi:type IV pilin protein [Massilia soli]|uniref:Type IV pilin protein n=1 Tax=Massilia soli TaxID=2792854 RepID=A0ABS7STX7_9BURK|nr:type IV pilin protein [Massilia soli]MBZ2209384.1 type IV pilin protein [Massilia soli]